MVSETYKISSRKKHRELRQDFSFIFAIPAVVRAKCSWKSEDGKFLLVETIQLEINTRSGNPQPTRRSEQMSVNGHIVELEVMFSSTSKCRQMCSWGETLFYFIWPSAIWKSATVMSWTADGLKANLAGTVSNYITNASNSSCERAKKLIEELFFFIMKAGALRYNINLHADRLCGGLTARWRIGDERDCRSPLFSVSAEYPWNKHDSATQKLCWTNKGASVVKEALAERYEKPLSSSIGPPVLIFCPKKMESWARRRNDDLRRANLATGRLMTERRWESLLLNMGPEINEKVISCFSVR